MRYFIILLLIGFSACSLSDVDDLRLKNYNGRVLDKYFACGDERHILELTKDAKKDTVDIELKRDFYLVPGYGAVHTSRLKSVSYTYFRNK